MVIPVYDDNPTRRRPYVTWALIAVNVVVFLLSPVARGPIIGQPSTAQLCRQQAYFLEYGAVPIELTHNRPLPFTYGEAAGENDNCDHREDVVAVRRSRHRANALQVRRRRGDGDSRQGQPLTVGDVARDRATSCLCRRRCSGGSAGSRPRG